MQLEEKVFTIDGEFYIEAQNLPFVRGAPGRQRNSREAVQAIIRARGEDRAQEAQEQFHPACLIERVPGLPPLSVTYS
jgi:hypothetical protein